MCSKKKIMRPQKKWKKITEKGRENNEKEHKITSWISFLENIDGASKDCPHISDCFLLLWSYSDPFAWSIMGSTMTQVLPTTPTNENEYKEKEDFNLTKLMIESAVLLKILQHGKIKL